jgi:hypothetical protein
MVRINKKRVMVNCNYKDIEITKDSIKSDQFLEIITARNVHLGSLECGGMKVLAKEIFIEGDIASSGSIVLAAMQIHTRRES